TSVRTSSRRSPGHLRSTVQGRGRSSDPPCRQLSLPMGPCPRSELIAPHRRLPGIARDSPPRMRQPQIRFGDFRVFGSLPFGTTELAPAWIDTERDEPSTSSKRSPAIFTFALTKADTPLIRTA